MKKIILTFIIAALSLATSHAQLLELADTTTLLVLFPANATLAYIENLKSQCNVTEIRVLPNTGVRIWKINSFPFTVSTGANTTMIIHNSTEAANHINSNTQVSSDPNYSVQYAQPTAVVPDTSDNCLWRTANKVPMICPMGTRKVIVAVADCGIGGSYNSTGTFNPHTTYNNLFKGKIWKNTTEQNDTQDNDRNGYLNDYTGWNFINDNHLNIDDNNHGSHVSGIIAKVLNRTQRVPTLENTDIITNPNLNPTMVGRNSLSNDIGDGSIGGGGIGSIPNANLIPQNVSIMNLKTQGANGKGSLRSLIEAIEYAMVKNANIMNLSLSYKGKKNGCNQSILKKVIDAAGIRKKMLFVVAAGNNDFNLDGNSDSTYFPAFFNCPNMIVVGADDTETGEKATFSNYGSISVDIAASGTGVYSTFRNGWGWMSGTSMAAPSVTAVAALLGTQQIWNYTTIKNAILNAPTLSDETPNNWDGFSSTGKSLNIAAILGCDENDLTTLRSKSAPTQTDLAALNAIPNPFSDFLQIQINSQQAAEGELFIQNALGQVVFHQKIVCQAGQNVIEWQSNEVNKGIYLVKVQLPNGVLTQKILKQ